MPGLAGDPRQSRDIHACGPRVVKEGRAEAMLAPAIRRLAKLLLASSEGTERPALATVLPSAKGQNGSA